MIETEPVETIHLYVVREEERRPYVVFPFFCAFLCLASIVAVTLYSVEHHYYEHERLTVPATFLTPKVFKAEVAIIPTGVKTYPATPAHGMLTITNGSIIAQVVPAGFTVQGIATDKTAYVPPGSANGYGAATVAAHALISGTVGNLPPLAVNLVIGSSVYIRNLSAFSGGRDSYSVNFITSHDKELALMKSRNLLASSVIGLHYPCTEKVSGSITVTWHCQFVRYTVPSYMRVLGVRLIGKNLLIEVVFTPPPVRIRAK